MFKLKLHYCQLNLNFFIFVFLNCCTQRGFSINIFMNKIVLVFLLCLPLICAEKNYTDTVNLLASKIKSPAHQHYAWNRLANISDTYGPRMWGSTVLEQVIQEMMNQANHE